MRYVKNMTYHMKRWSCQWFNNIYTFTSKGRLSNTIFEDSIFQTSPQRIKAGFILYFVFVPYASPTHFLGLSLMASKWKERAWEIKAYQSCNPDHIKKLGQIERCVSSRVKVLYLLTGNFKVFFNSRCVPPKPVTSFLQCMKINANLARVS